MANTEFKARLWKNNNDYSLSSKNDNPKSAPLISLASDSNDYIFKITILSENSTYLSEFNLNVNCKNMSSNSSSGTILSPTEGSLNWTLNTALNTKLNCFTTKDSNSSFLGLLMTLFTAIVIVIIGSLFCLFIKRYFNILVKYFNFNFNGTIFSKSICNSCRKYNISTPEYLLNFKPYFMFKSSSNSNQEPHNQKTEKQDKSSSNAFLYLNQFQLQPKQQQYQFSASNKPTTASSSSTSNFCQNKNPTFNYNYGNNYSIFFCFDF